MQTTAAVLTWTLYCMAQHPHHVAALHAEVPWPTLGSCLGPVLSMSNISMPVRRAAQERCASRALCAVCTRPVAIAA
jgi:cytochrome P450